MQGYDIKQSSSGFPLLFLMVDSTDHITGKTGLSPTVTISKNGGSFSSPSGSVTEIANGWYKVAGNATDSNTLGPLILHATDTGADPTDAMFSVVAYDPQDSVRLGLTALPNATAGASNGLPLSVDSSGRVDVLKVNGTTQTARDIGASVLLSSGTGSGQVSLTSGKVDVNDKTGFSLSSAGVQAIWDYVVDGTRTAVQLMRGMVAALLGKSSGHGTGTPKYRDVGDTKNVIDATTDADGNRTAVTLTLT